MGLHGENVRVTFTLRPYQEKALAAIDGRRRTWVVLPPGAGKTLVGLEAARRLGRTTVVFVPNTAIQHQWTRFGGGTSRDLDLDVNVLTYQSLAVFDPDGETEGGGLASRLHENGRELIKALRAVGPVTLVLDECHHLLDVWGRLLAEVLDDLPDAYVIGLTATPPESLTPEEKDLVDTLFGEPVLGASMPALVRQGYLAPFAELAWLTPPTAEESAYIAAEAERFTELTTDLLAPGFATTGFLTWLDLRRDALRDEPAVLRFCHAGLLEPPPGVRPLEEHRHDPTAEDWVALLDDYLKNCLLASGDPKDERAVEAIRAALPAVGYQLTRRGIRVSRSPVDRVLARSAAKTHGAVEIAAAEAASLGDRLRCLVLCDHERAGATLPARLRDVLDEQAGSARLMVARLLADPRTRPLNPMLVTGRTVAAGPETARELAALVPGLTVTEDDGLHVLTGWTSRAWVPVVTQYFEDGHCQALVGTRALLGEGWDARGVNTLIDLTTATTPTSVVQTRGRGVRLDPAWPDKTANTWTVVCVTDRHPKGAADWTRFVRKHQGYLAATTTGEIVSGVAHVDAAFSPYAPPDSPDASNAAMLVRAADRAAVRASWRIGEPFHDELVHTIRIRRRGGQPKPTTSATPTIPAILPAPDLARPLPRRWRATRPRPDRSRAARALPGRSRAARALPARALPGWWRAARVLDLILEEPPLLHLAYAVADGLAACELSRLGAEGVDVRVEPDGSYRCCLADASERFALALDELISPMASPRYVIPRYVVRPRKGRERRRRARAWRRGRALPDGVVYHSVPAVLGQNRTRADAFAVAWNRWVSAGDLVYTASAEGEGVLATHRGEDPFAATTVLRVAWS